MALSSCFVSPLQCQCQTRVLLCEAVLQQQEGQELIAGRDCRPARPMDGGSQRAPSLYVCAKTIRSRSWAVDVCSARDGLLLYNGEFGAHDGFDGGN